MRRTSFLPFCTSVIVLSALCINARSQSFSPERTIELINEYGTFDSWCVREIKESGIIGGKTKYLYEFYGQQDTLRTGKEPYKSPADYLWRTNNVLAVVAGIVKTNNTVFPEKRGDGYCARIETHIEEVKALGIVNMDVTCQGALLLGALPEPIRDTKDPMAKVNYGIPFNDCPKAVQFDYKSDVGHETVRGTGFSKLKPLGVPDYAQITCILQKRWEDEDGEVHALRVATGIKLITESVSEWQNGYRIEFRYGDITSEADFQPYMGLKNCDGGPTTAYHTTNSNGKNVTVHEDGWAEPGTEPNTLIVSFLASCGDAFYGGIGNILWVDNVNVIM